MRPGHRTLSSLGKCPLGRDQAAHFRARSSEPGRFPRTRPGRDLFWLSLLKTVNYQESLRIFLCDRRTVRRHDHHSICSRLRALVPVSQPSVVGTRACRAATSADRLAAATPSPPRASFRRSAPVGVPLPSVAAGPRRLGTRQTGDSGQMASPRLSDLLVVAITLSRTPQDERRNPGPDPSDESRQSALGRASHPRRTAQARHRRQPSYCRQAPPPAP